MPNLTELFPSNILRRCFSFGGMLERGSADGNCFAAGLRERAAIEKFMLAFDSNLAPMAGQRLTLVNGDGEPAFLTEARRAAFDRPDTRLSTTPTAETPWRAPTADPRASAR